MKNSVYDPGELDRKISFTRDTETPDGMAGVNTQRLPFYLCWAKVKSGKPVEKLTEDGLRVYEECVFIIRRPIVPILESDFIVYGGRSFEIRGIPTFNERDQYILIHAERGVDV